MTDLIERAKAALEWNDTHGLRLLAPDLARLAIAQHKALQWIADNPHAHPANASRVVESAIAEGKG